MDLLPDDLPSGKRRATAAVGIVVIVSVGLYAFDVFLLDPAFASKHVGIIRNVLENLIAGAIAAIALALLYRKVVTWIDPGDRVLEIDPNRITERLLANARRSQRYVFVGNTATFVSTSVLPVLIDCSSKAGQVRHIDLVLIDPGDADTVRSYSIFKAGVSRSDAKVADSGLARWTPPEEIEIAEPPHVVRGKVLSAIYIAAFAATTAGIVAQVYLRKGFTPFRADISDAEVVLTQESISEGAVAFSARGHFYGWYQKEYEALKSQSKRLDLAGDRPVLERLALACPASDRVRIRESLLKLLTVYGHLQLFTHDEAAIDEAVRRIANPTHSYRR